MPLFGEFGVDQAEAMTGGAGGNGKGENCS